MGTAVIPERELIVAPLPASNQVDAVGKRSSQDIARSVLQGHSAGLDARRQRDLISEKLLLHIDGSGDFMWADILYDQRVTIPRLVSEYRKTENLLRLVVDNAVAHHTTMPLRYFADSLPDRRAQDRALIDTVWMNHLAQQQDLNGLFADAMYMAMPAGFCPVHRYWRDDSVDAYESVKQTSEEESVMQTTGGMIDCWVGNPFDTVFDRAAKRNSVYWASYGRVLPASMVRAAFDHVPEARSLEGTNKIPSASIFQRIAREWKTEGLGVHGTPVITHRREADSDEELILLLCREVLLGVEADWPQGRLQIVAVPGTVDLRRREGQSTHAILLADQALPAGDFSWTNFYSHQRAEDILGKPWVEDIDQLNVDLNIALSKRWEVINRMVEAPIVVPGGAISEDMADLDGYNILEVEPNMATWRPQVMRWPDSVVTALDKECQDRRRAIYTGGGYQASSRGEAPGSRMAYRAIVALQQADNSIHGPVNLRFRRSATDFARGCWKQMKRYGDVPWLINITGSEYAHLVEPYIDNSKLSDRPPQYKLVNAFGPSPELRAQEVLELMATRGADGEVFLRTEEARRQYPNPMIFDDAGDPKAVQRRRAKTVASAFHQITAQYREQTNLVETNISHPWVQQAAMQVFGEIETRYPRLRDDDLGAHLSTLSEITQDETADPIARLAAMRRQELYYQWQASMAGQPGATNNALKPGEGPARPNELDPRSIAREMRGGAVGTMLDDEDGGELIASTARG